MGDRMGRRGVGEFCTHTRECRSGVQQLACRCEYYSSAAVVGNESSTAAVSCDKYFVYTSYICTSISFDHLRNSVLERERRNTSGKSRTTYSSRRVVQVVLVMK